MTAETVAYVVLAFCWGFVAALWLHDPLKRCVHRMVEREFRRGGWQVIDYDFTTETGWMTAMDGSHTPIVSGHAFPRAMGLVANGPVGTRTMLGERVDGLVSYPTRAEHERQENARRRDMLRLEARAHGLTPERVVELRKASGQGEKHVKTWEAR